MSIHSSNGQRCCKGGKGMQAIHIKYTFDMKLKIEGDTSGVHTEIIDRLAASERIYPKELARI